MHRIAKFHFVSPGQFLTAMQEGYPQYTEAQIKDCLLYTSDAADE